ncbi:MAG: hypothetical protein C6H99_06565 [Epsilonproteobacteria bacterium]|nr:hypothetical protein [Campylobacterota bacterium]NPA63434.1 hypothetical protein [Campylobacterota bacterium]
MHISDEGLLTQLGYNSDEANLHQLRIIQEKTPGFDQIKRHILALHDHLKNYGGFVAISSSQPYFKIKLDPKDPSALEQALEEMNRWANKYKVRLQKVQDKQTYYILGLST